MMTRRLGVAVAVLHGYLYAIGGSDGQNPLNSVERYDPQKNTWTVMAPMSTRRKHLGCARAYLINTDLLEKKLDLMTMQHQSYN